MHLSRRPQPGGRPPRFVREAGFGLVEITIATSLLVVGCLGLLGSAVGSVRLLSVNRERARAHAAAHTLLERLESANFSLLFANYNHDPTDDPAGAGSSPGANFAVVGLTAQKGDADGLPGEIRFPTVGGAGLQLSEAVVDPRWGMPRDLDGDGAETGGALAGAYVILPVRIRIAWRGVGGNQVLEIDDLLVDHGG